MAVVINLQYEKESGVIVSSTLSEEVIKIHSKKYKEKKRNISVKKSWQIRIWCYSIIIIDSLYENKDNKMKRNKNARSGKIWETESVFSISDHVKWLNLNLLFHHCKRIIIISTIKEQYIKFYGLARRKTMFLMILYFVDALTK